MLPLHATPWPTHAHHIFQFRIAPHPHHGVPLHVGTDAVLDLLLFFFLLRQLTQFTASLLSLAITDCLRSCGAVLLFAVVLVLVLHGAAGDARRNLLALRVRMAIHHPLLLWVLFDRHKIV